MIAAAAAGSVVFGVVALVAIGSIVLSILLATGAINVSSSSSALDSFRAEAYTYFPRHIISESPSSQNFESGSICRDGSLVAVGSRDGTVRVYNAASALLLQNLTDHGGDVNVYSTEFSHDCTILASAGEVGAATEEIILWNPITGAKIASLKNHSANVNEIAFNHDSTLLASVADDDTVKIWDVSTRAVLRTLSGHTADVETVAFNHDSTLLASGSDDETVKIWNPSTGALIRTLSGHTDDVDSVEFSRDSSLIASASADDTVRIWRGVDGQLLNVFELVSDASGVGFSPSGILATADDDDYVKLWDPNTGTLLRSLQKFASNAEQVAFSDSGVFITVSDDDDNSLIIWDTQCTSCTNFL